MLRREFLICLICVVLLSFTTGLEASSRFSIRGAVVDQYDNPIAGVTVRLKSGNTMSTMSDSKGAFSFSSLMAGQEGRMTWERNGVRTVTLEKIKVPPVGEVFVKLIYMDTRVGGTTVVRLASNSSTGYSWSFAGGESDVLIPVGRVMEAMSEKDPHMARGGAGGHELWLYRAIKRGEATFVFNYSRSWEPHIPPYRIAVVSTVIK